MFLALIAKSLNFFTIFFLSLCSVYERPIHHICTFFFIFLPFFGSSGLPSFVVSVHSLFKLSGPAASPVWNQLFNFSLTNHIHHAGILLVNQVVEENKENSNSLLVA